MIDIWESLGLFRWPLLLFSIAAVAVICERLFVLRTGQVCPRSVVDDLVKGNLSGRDDNSIADRVINFYLSNKPDPEAFKAYVQLEAIRLERGLFVLDIVIAGAPLIGLLGTVWGLVEVFGGVSPETGIPEMSAFIPGIARALSTTMVGLIVAIVALVGNSYLVRRVDLLTARLNLVVERIIDISLSKHEAAGEARK